jgi:hypothetical protein
MSTAKVKMIIRVKKNQRKEKNKQQLQQSTITTIMKENNNISQYLLLAEGKSVKFYNLGFSVSFVEGKIFCFCFCFCLFSSEFVSS